MTNEHHLHIQSPYKGLAPYDIGDKDNFFGRERETQILLGKIFANNITLLFAGTGVGKSSLLRAAIMPELTEQHALDVVYYADWVSEPLDGVKATIRQTLIANGKLTERELKLNDDLAPFLEVCVAYASEPLMLILDQFEELFQYHAHSGRLLPFVEQVARVVNAQRLPVSVVLSMREDFLAELNVFKGHIPGLFDNYYRLEQLSIEQAREAIEKPVAKLGVRYQDGLVDQLLRDLAAREQASQADFSAAHQVVEPPYLQIVCNELWRAERENPQQVITTDRYVALGGAQEIILKHFRLVMSRFSLREQSLAFEMFRYLVTERGTKMAYRADDLASSQLLGVPVAELQPILAHLASKEARILRADQRLDQTWYELYHDAFAQIIRAWSKEFQADENRRMYRQLTNAARKWANARRDDSLLLSGVALLETKEWQKRYPAETLAPQEQHFLRQSLAKYSCKLWLWRGIVAAITVLAVIAAGFGLYANTQRNIAKNQEEIAKAQTKKAVEERKKADAQKEIADTRTNEAVEERKKVESANREIELQSKLARIRSLIAYAYKDNSENQRERAALLARHAAFLVRDYLDKQYHDKMLNEILVALRTIFGTRFILEPELYSKNLFTQVCQKVRFKLELTDKEWQTFTDNAFPYKPVCPQLQQNSPRLRSEPMVATDYMALSLTIADAGSQGFLAHEIENSFKNRDKAVFDERTGLLWEKSGSKEGMPYDDAIHHCDNQGTAGYNDWRLPTIEELLSLVELQKQGNGLYIDPIFVTRQGNASYFFWYWSADIYQRPSNESNGGAWMINFSRGDVGWEWNNNNYQVRCVRSGQ